MAVEVLMVAGIAMQAEAVAPDSVRDAVAKLAADALQMGKLCGVMGEE